MITVLARPDGTVQCVYTERIDLAAIGPLEISRASCVEPDQAGWWWVDLMPAGGPVLGPFQRRSAALAAEEEWLEENLCSLSGRPSAARSHQ